MVTYLYKTVIYFDTENVIGIDIPTENANKTDFEMNYKSQTVPVNNLSLAETVFLILKTYADFKTLIDGANIKWSDVKCEMNRKYYDLYLITNSPI